MALDGCHIKAKYGGVILAATILDWNGSVFPAAVGIAESENEATWMWFLRLLTHALQKNDEGEGIVVLSDREKGLKKAVKECLRQASHSYCVFHILKNVKSKYHVGFDGLIFQAAKAVGCGKLAPAKIEITLVEYSGGKSHFIGQRNDEKLHVM